MEEWVEISDADRAEYESYGKVNKCQWALWPGLFEIVLAAPEKGWIFFSLTTVRESWLESSIEQRLRKGIACSGCGIDGRYMRESSSCEAQSKT